MPKNYFFSRRSFNASQGRFTSNFASLTRYVGVSSSAEQAGSGDIMDRDQWISEVLNSAGSDDIVIFVHGFNVSQSEMLIRQRKLSAGLAANGFNGAVVGLDWPSDGSVFRYLGDKADAKRTGPYLVIDGIGPLTNAKPGIRIHVIAHSMGTYLTLRGFSQVGDSGAPGSVPWGVEQAIFLAGDIDEAWLQSGAWGALVMERRAKRLTNYYSTFDEILALSEITKGGTAPRAGRRGMPPNTPATHVDLYCGEQYQLKIPDAQKSARMSHAWYFDEPGLHRDVAMTLAGQSAQSMPTRLAASNGDQALRA